LLRHFRLRALRYGRQGAVRNDVRYGFSFSRRENARVCKNLVPPMTEGAGNAGRSARPQPRAQCRKGTRQSPWSRRKRPAFPAQWFYGLFGTLPGDLAFLSPSPRGFPRGLTPASRRQDHNGEVIKVIWVFGKSECLLQGGLDRRITGLPASGASLARARDRRVPAGN
jgi:hypothetical protein